MQVKLYKGFTLIELLVVISIIGALTAMMFPVLGMCKNSARMAVCRSNLRQLVIANKGYAEDNDGYSVPGGLNITTENLQRWYGSRESKYDEFDPEKGLLTPYLESAQLECPQKVRYMEVEPVHEKYEGANGGYGYNFVYLGSRIWKSGYGNPDSSNSTQLGRVKRPGQTLIFTDTAMVSREENGEGLMRYAFIEPYMFVIYGEATPTWVPDPSMHFRHGGRVCAAWVDGHVDVRKSSGYDGENYDGCRPGRYDLGWFEPLDNSLIDLD
ncbi:PilD-dependent protein PddA [Anaerohalosphaera lusitana]|uniref:PilD-dependent protein PddA n=1 Tax=Anaerohalosphaera lusitana TaxID=1936003 RepID=A0A1U9NPE5_9BACT|nr:type II secretion system protein [Anaerohalosphaera lusitana]AQT69779.1 PilD-dependent protein PddA [Anaerohalosphaera lusitana]